MGATRKAVRFLLDGEIRTVDAIEPTFTVLEYLRTVAGRCGTKEGCAEGDCGACTVAVGELVDGKVRYQAVNSCILLLPTLDGKQLVTVESLAGQDGSLHPVQRAMVDLHASQCGFCTPGFVMSLFALRESGASHTRQRIGDVLAGNLCRCTGYRPIVDAGLQACLTPDPVPFAATAAEQLASIQSSDMLSLRHGERRFFAPTTLDQLAELYVQYPEAQLLAGGTDIGVWVAKQLRDLPIVLSLGRVAALNTITEDDDAIEIGAGVTYTNAAASLARHYPDFGELIRRLGSVQIRNSGTIGGNIGNGSPIGNSLPALMALDATLSLRCGVTERTLPLEAFFTGYRKTALVPGEFITRIRVPLKRPAHQFGVYKISKRFDQDISAICGAFSLRLDGDRVADLRLCFGGMAATPARARSTEAALIGQIWSETAITTAGALLEREFAPISDQRASDLYRRTVARNLLRKFYLETTKTAAPTRILSLAEAWP